MRTTSAFYVYRSKITKGARNPNGSPLPVPPAPVTFRIIRGRKWPKWGDYVSPNANAAPWSPPISMSRRLPPPRQGLSCGQGHPRGPRPVTRWEKPNILISGPWGRSASMGGPGDRGGGCPQLGAPTQQPFRGRRGLNPWRIPPYMNTP